MQRIVDDYIEREKTLLSRPDGIQLTGIERPNIIAPFKPSSEPELSIFPSKPARFNPVVKEILDRVDTHVKNLADGVEASVKRLSGVVDNGSKTASSISTALPVAFQDTSKPIAKRVTFSPFKFRVWSSDGSGFFSGSGAKEELKNKKVPVGTYLLTIKTPFALPDITEFDSAIPFSVDGKHAVLEKVAYDKDSLELKLQVRIVQNFVFLVAVVAGALTAGGYFLGKSGDFIEQSVVAIDRVLDTTIVGFVVVGGGLFIAKRMGYI